MTEGTLRTVVGIDGGGTKTTGVMLDETGTVLAEATGRGMNVQVLGPDALISRIVPFLRSLQDRAGTEPDAYCLALAGAGRSEDRDAVQKAAGGTGLRGVLLVTSDAQAALEGAHPGDSGIILIAGTGSIAFGRDQTGQTIRAGGWGYLLDDGGSGHDIGKRALVSCLRAKDGRGPETILSAKLLSVFGLKNWEGLVHRAYGEGIGQQELAALAPLVFEAAREEDVVARRIIDAAGRELGLLTSALLRKLDMDAMPRVSLIGGLFREREMLMPSLMSEIEEAGYRIHIVPPRFPPEIGAGLLAARKAGIDITENMLANLERYQVSSK